MCEFSTAAPACLLLCEADILRLLPPRAPDANKGSFGTLLLLCGSYGMIGAAAMAARAALRCGVGLVNMAVRKECYPLLAPMVPEAVFTILDTNNAAATTQSLTRAMTKATACTIGCGLGADASAYLPTMMELLRAQPCPTVLDADALNYLSGNLHLLTGQTAPLILTPHPAEMGRLAGIPTAQVQQNRLSTAINFATAHQVHTILKGAGTILAAPDGSATQNPTGNAGMAKGGSGDVLAGMLGAFLAQGLPPKEAAQVAVYIHGAAGDLCASEYSQRAMLPTDLIAYLPRYFAAHEAQ